MNLISRVRTAALALAITMAAACDRTPKAEPVTIRMIGEAYAPLNALKELKGDFEKQTGIKVEIVEKDHQAVVSELDQELATRQVTYDLILMPHRLLGKLVTKNRVQPIDAFIADKALHDSAFKPNDQLFPEWWKEISWYDGKAYGYPFTALTMYVAYRKDLLEDPAQQAAFQRRFGRALTPPKTWTEYKQLAEFFTQPDKKLYGTYIQGQQHVALWYEWLNFAYSFGGNILDTKHGYEYGDIVVNSPENIKATGLYVSLLKSSPPEATNYNWDDALAALQQGRVFMGIIWHDQTPLIEDTTASKVAGKMAYSLIPSETGRAFSQLEGWSYLIPTESKHPREAYRFIEWAMSASVQRAQTLKGGASAMKATYDDSAVTRIPYVPAFLASIPVGVPKPTIPESSQITEIMQRGLSEIVTGKKTPKQGLDALAVEIGTALHGKAKLRYPVAQR